MRFRVAGAWVIEGFKSGWCSKPLVQYFPGMVNPKDNSSGKPATPQQRTVGEPFRLFSNFMRLQKSIAQHLTHALK